MDIVVTWPKNRPLDSYLDELHQASEHDLLINFRVPTRPSVQEGEKCFHVYDGFIRGWTEIIGVEHRDDVVLPTTQELMAAGFFVVRKPQWHALGCGVSWCTVDLRHMRGFQGFRYMRGSTPATVHAKHGEPLRR